MRVSSVRPFAYARLSATSDASCAGRNAYRQTKNPTLLTSIIAAASFKYFERVIPTKNDCRTVCARPCAVPDDRIARHDAIRGLIYESGYADVEMLAGQVGKIVGRDFVIRRIVHLPAVGKFGLFGTFHPAIERFVRRSRYR